MYAQFDYVYFTFLHTHVDAVSLIYEACSHENLVRRSIPNMINLGSKLLKRPPKFNEMRRERHDFESGSLIPVHVSGMWQHELYQIRDEHDEEVAKLEG